MSNEAHTEREIVRTALRRIRAGDPEPYARIVEVFQRRLFSLALMIVRDRAAAEDVVQESFVRAYTHIDSFDEQREFYPWIATITARLAQNWRRSRGRASIREERAALDDREQMAHSDAASDLMANERAHRLWEAVSALPQAERSAVHLYYRQEMNVTEVAQVLGVTVGTVKTLLFRARRKLRESISMDESLDRPVAEELQS